MTIPSDGFADGGEAYTDEEMEIINHTEVRDAIGVVLEALEHLSAGFLLDMIDYTPEEFQRLDNAIDRLQEYMIETM